MAEGLGAVVDQRGALKKAVTYAEKAIRRGGSWCYLDEMAETVHFLYVDRRFDQELTEAWSQHEQQASLSAIDDAKSEAASRTVPPAKAALRAVENWPALALAEDPVDEEPEAKAPRRGPKAIARRV